MNKAPHLVLAAAVFAAAGAQAAIIASDTFESYTANAQFENGTVQLNGGTGFSSAYNINNSNTSAVVVNDQGISYNGIDGGSRSMMMTGVNGDAIVSRQFPSQTGTLYFSFLLRTNNPSNSEDFVQIGLASGASGEPNLSLGTQNNSSTPNRFFVRAGAGGTSVIGTGDGAIVAPSTSYLLVGKVWKSTPGAATKYDNVALYLNPTSLIEPGSATITASKDAAVSSLAYFVIRTARVEGTDIYRLDNLSIGTSFAEVVPEPVLAPATLGLMAVAAMRRRRA